MTGRRVVFISGCAALLLAAAWFWQRSQPVSPRLREPVSLEAAVETPAATRPTLWVLAVGVSQYQHPEIALQFGDADARAVAAALEQQGRGPIYRETNTLLLVNDEVTRESVLAGIERFLGQAGPDDVAAIFMAGHGVQDRATGSYYFLPYPATPETLLTTGLRMSDFDEVIRVLRRNVRRVVVMLDTCHAGALRFGARAAVASDDLAAQVSSAEGLFVLAATKPGEESTEKPELGHGAFTYALLEGLNGAADVRGHGLVTVSDLFSYVARNVPRLTDGRQHPYHKMEGTDLPFAAVMPVAEAAEPLAPVVPVQRAAAPEVAVTPIPNAIAVMEFRNLRRDPENNWIGQALRAALDTELVKVRVLRVLSPDLIDRKRAEGLDDLLTARQLGISKLLTGTFAVVGKTIRIDATIVDVASGVHEGSDSVQGDLDDFFALQKQLILSILARLQVEVSATEAESIKEETNTTVDAYRLLLQAEGLAEAPTPPATKKPAAKARGAARGPHSRLRDWEGWRNWLARSAYAEETVVTDEAAVRAFLDEYRRALEAKDLARLAELYVSFPPQQRDGQQRYLDNAEQLTVVFDDVVVTPQPQGVSVSFTRRDRFIDRASGKSARLEVHLTKTLVREGGRWKIASGH